MTKDEALRLALEALEVANSLVDGYYLPKEKAWVPEIEEAITVIKAALEAKDEPVGSFMTRLQAIDFLLKMRPQTEPTEKQIIATIDAYSALFGDMIESPVLPKQEAKDEPVGLIESLKDAKPCCGQYETCWRACTPRGKFIGHRDAQRKPLTDDEITLIIADCASSHQHTDIHLARAIEAAHGIKGEA